MASNFKIYVSQDGDRLDLVIQGDFDGTSACELLNVLMYKSKGIDRVFIDTSGLNEIYPFGQDTFQNNLYVLNSQNIRLVFTGKNATLVAPERSRFCQIV